MIKLKKNIHFFPIQPGVLLKKEAILTAELARESLDTNWIKLELISEDEMLLPDPIELYSTREDLIKKNLKYSVIVLTIRFCVKDWRILVVKSLCL